MQKYALVFGLDYDWYDYDVEKITLYVLDLYFIAGQDW